MFSFLYNDRDRTLGDQRIAIVHPNIDDLPKSAQGYTANNVYPGFPPLMADGRALIGAWQPESYENDAIVRAAGITSNWDYRQYLTKNAATIARRNFTESANDVGFYERGAIEPRGTFAPMQASASSAGVYLSSGIPEHPYGRSQSDLKTAYLSREQLAAQRVSPAITQEELVRVMASRRA